mmetsp:Transcript_8743/g.12369  ORF Transcript_8743/g.12369 Transcript_8743/m.12369 type:complete len:571 (+) Transcript_8743:209-1921(+)
MSGSYTRKPLPPLDFKTLPKPTPEQISAAIIAANDKRKEPTFPMKLMSILKPDSGYAGIIGWRNDGKSFYITKPQDLCDIVLPRVLGKHIKYMSFLRRLDRWGFKCEHIGSLWGTKLDVFSHPEFQRGVDCSAMMPVGEKERTKPIKRRKKSLKRKKATSPKVYEGPKEPPLALQQQEQEVTSLPKMISPPIPATGSLKSGFPPPGTGLNPSLPSSLTGGVAPPTTRSPLLPQSKATASAAALAGGDLDMFGMAVEMEVTRRLREVLPKLATEGTRPSFPSAPQDRIPPPSTNAASMIHHQREMDMSAVARRRAELMKSVEEEEEEKTLLMLFERRKEKEQLLAQLQMEQQKEEEVHQRMMVHKRRLARMRAAEEDRIILQDEVAEMKFLEQKNMERGHRLALRAPSTPEDRFSQKKYCLKGPTKSIVPPGQIPLNPKGSSGMGDPAGLDPSSGAFKKLPNPAHDKIITGAMMDLKVNQAAWKGSAPASFQEGWGARPSWSSPSEIPSSGFHEDMITARKLELLQARKEEFLVAAAKHDRQALLTGMYPKELPGMGRMGMPNAPPFYQTK